jgi:hypothetical protein
MHYRLVGGAYLYMSCVYQLLRLVGGAYLYVYQLPGLSRWPRDPPQQHRTWRCVHLQAVVNGGEAEAVPVSSRLVAGVSAVLGSGGPGCKLVLMMLMSQGACRHEGGARDGASTPSECCNR